ncbi:thiol-disulfide oxidoreductase DCC family protein [Brevibacillus ruminantium]|uniref:Thiol-disulfide oxidoreductase DCC family protein n=1 Tax=Brevibacillus ruminantium TaxID=2950604 RepID=A0ABY4WC92_9BACL|nr:thiol-disulfide oxidoreductase DCC family protein [Brevibacillus ruminantium]USG63788.1 thiol-disulfide oxidoreductase DCC family protein [Brevibacillus ruminantium]
MSDTNDPGTILLFDGACNFCHGAVRFIIPRDPAGRIHFTSLQSDVGKRLLEAYSIAPDSIGSVILIDGGKAYLHSDAVLRTGRLLHGGWPLLSSIGYLLPRPIRDALYRYIARNRYRWFGEASACLLPTAELHARFLE